MFSWDKAIGIALRTWYPKDDPLHFNPHHPLGKLCGEWGELLDDYMKSLYKPGYEFEPEDELGDIWYYLRILCYQQHYVPQSHASDLRYVTETEYLIACAIKETSQAFIHLFNETYYSTDLLDHAYSTLDAIASRHRLNLRQITDSNWQKLKPGSERGEEWSKARIQEETNGT